MEKSMDLQNYLDNNLSCAFPISLKSIIFNEDECKDEVLPILNKENKKNHKEIIPKIKTKLIYDYTDSNDFEDFTNSINDKDLNIYLKKHQEYYNFQKTL